MALQKCCLCLSLRAGTIAIATVFVVLGVVDLIFFILGLSGVASGYLSSSYVVNICVVVVILFSLAVSIGLLVGAIKRIKFPVMFWMICSCIFFILAIIYVIYVSAELFMSHQNLDGTITLLVGLALIGVYIYYWLIVRSFYLLLSGKGGEGD